MRPVFVTTLLVAICSTAIACADGPTTGGPGTPGTMEDYVPDVAIAYNARYLDGSFEDNQGFGWDTCYTRTPGKISRPLTGGSEGSSHVTFESSIACEGTCSPTNSSSSHLYTWFSAAPSATARMGLYFDVKNLSGTGAEPTGVLRFYGTDLSCAQDSVLAEIELARLRMSSGWSTRCVTVTGPGADSAIGTAVSGGAHTVGIDALRLGPPCHAGS
jgi:hypothetical protein